MIVCGCDIGSLTAKAVIMENGRILASEVMRTGIGPGKIAEEVFEKALQKSGLSRNNVQRTVGTGYGKNKIPFADDVQSEIACHAKGAKWIIPSVNMVIDIGGQDAKAIKVNDDGSIKKYVYNDVCASGSGRFLEVMAEALNVELEEMGELSLKAEDPVNVSSQCVIFAETEVISILNEGRNINDILGGLHKSMARRVVALARSIGIEQDITFTGGVAKNIGVYKTIETELGVPLKKMEKIDPQLTGAVGAALLAENQVAGQGG